MLTWTSRSVATLGLFHMDLVLLNRSQTTAPELATSLQPSAQAWARLTHVRFNMHQVRKQGGSSLESGFEPGAEALPLGPRGP
ncbi:hypothetical protein AVEN_228983-1 [Araneus ventricosus]|uniref:Uncharacterized protein n=1 Tax=Araneus ventricosus TaxID=182803 RepID=A0A4Y2I6G1_ARAVE|nr:hypothetical protein AVEN_228983-1 [Araneus ventricosus]